MIVASRLRLFVSCSAAARVWFVDCPLACNTRANARTRSDRSARERPRTAATDPSGSSCDMMFYNLGSSVATLDSEFVCVCRIINCLNLLTKRECKGLNTGLQEFDLKSPAFHLMFLPDELMQTILSNLARAVRSGVHPTIDARRDAVQCHLKANGFTILRRPQHHV